MNRRRGPNESPFAEPGLDALQWAMRHGGLAQLVPSGYYGSPGFTFDGATNREETGNHLMVRLDIWESSGAWHAVFGIYDGDDMCIQVWRPLTWGNWRALVSLHQLVCAGIDESVLRYVRSREGACG